MSRSCCWSFLLLFTTTATIHDKSKPEASEGSLDLGSGELGIKEATSMRLEIVLEANTAEAFLLSAELGTLQGTKDINSHFQQLQLVN